jgi:hypothetical protein
MRQHRWRDRAAFGHAVGGIAETNGARRKSVDETPSEAALRVPACAACRLFTAKSSNARTAA